MHIALAECKFLVCFAQSSTYLDLRPSPLLILKLNYDNFLCRYLNAMISAARTDLCEFTDFYMPCTFCGIASPSECSVIFSFISPDLFSSFLRITALLPGTLAFEHFLLHLGDALDEVLPTVTFDGDEMHYLSGGKSPAHSI